MPTLPFVQVDAFTTEAYSGNPCAVVFDADDLTPAQMQAIAREMNLSETAFVLHSDVADLRARYFTPAEEVPLAGHPTISTLHALVTTGRLAVEGSASIRLQLEAGVITVDIDAADPKQPLVTMAQRPPSFGRTYAPEDILPLFGLDAADGLAGAPIRTVSTGTPQLMIPLASAERLRHAQVEIRPYVAMRQAGDFFSAHLFVLGGVTPRGATFARHFGTPPDLFEDPFTGSATGGMAAYLWSEGLIDEPRFIAEQGHWMGRPGEAYVEVVGPPDAIETVRVGGYAADVLHGDLTPPVAS